MNSYFTIKEVTSGEYKEKGSKFLSYAFPVESEEDIKSCQEQLRKKYHDARHHCFAWVLGMDDQSWRANDDGEPSHSAGDPILGQIRSFELTNTLIVVVRYFGGTKLGVGGLINAYKTASMLALEKATKHQIYETAMISFEFTYQELSIVERLIGDFKIEVKDREYQEDCKVVGFLRKEQLDSFNRSIIDLYSIKIRIDDEDIRRAK